MAGYADLIRDGVALANSMTSSLQPNVLHHPYGGSDGVGGKNYGLPISRPAIVEEKQKLVVSSTGDEVVSSHSILFLSNVLVDPQDQFTLPNGDRARVLSVDGFADKDVGGTFYTQVYVGK